MAVANSCMLSRASSGRWAITRKRVDIVVTLSPSCQGNPLFSTGGMRDILISLFHFDFDVFFSLPFHILIDVVATCKFLANFILFVTVQACFCLTPRRCAARNCVEVGFAATGSKTYFHTILAKE
jgi:hypothetical protein